MLVSKPGSEMESYQSREGKVRKGLSLSLEGYIGINLVVKGALVEGILWIKGWREELRQHILETTSATS